MTGQDDEAKTRESPVSKEMEIALTALRRIRSLEEKNVPKYAQQIAKEALDRLQQATKEREMTDEQIKHMVDRFLSWKLPESFNPDAGISFKKTFNEHTAHPMKHEPSGTNLFDATQADAMVRHMIDGLPRS